MCFIVVAIMIFLVLSTILFFMVKESARLIDIGTWFYLFIVYGMTIGFVFLVGLTMPSLADNEESGGEITTIPVEDLDELYKQFDTLEEKVNKLRYGG